MSERVFEGAATVRQLPQRGMISLRGDLQALAKAVTVPERGTCTGDIAWMSRDELLVMCPQTGVADRIAALKGKLAGTHHMVTDVSDARVIFEITGKHAAETLAKLCPVNVGAMLPGRFHRTRLAQIACAFWMRDDGVFELVCFTSVADYAWGVLSNAAATPVGHLVTDA